MSGLLTAFARLRRQTDVAVMRITARTGFLIALLFAAYAPAVAESRSSEALLALGRDAYYRFDRTSLARAQDLFKRAHERNPDDVDALAWQALTALRMHAAGHRANEFPASIALDEARALALRGSRLEPGNALVLVAQSGIVQWFSGDHIRAVELASSAIAARPKDADVRLHVARRFAIAQQPVDARRHLAVLAELEPAPGAGQSAEVGAIHVINGDYEAALVHLEKARVALPDYRWLRAMLAAAYARQDRPEAAKAEIAAFISEPKDNWRWLEMWFANWAPAVRGQLLSTLRLAGLPEWPAGFTGKDEERLDGAIVRRLVFGGIRIDATRHGTFEIDIGRDGRAELRQGSYLLSGQFWLEGDRLCYTFAQAAFGRTLCGRVYRNPAGSYAAKNEYVFVSPVTVYHFSMKR
jgi:adenylate cyclase